VPPFTSMAVHTAVAVIFIALAILLSRRDGSLTAFLASPGAGGSIVRRFLPMCGVVLGLAGLIGVGGRAFHFYEAEFGFGLFLLLSCITLAVFVWSSADEVERLELRNAQTMAALVREQEAAAAEDRFRAIASSAQDAIVSADSSGQIMTWNGAAERIFGYSASEAIGLPLLRLMPQRYHEAHQAGMIRFGRDGERRVIGKTVELAGLRRDGSEFPCELSLSSWERDGKSYLTGFLRDISDRVRVRDQLAQSELRFRTLVEHAPVAIFETNVAGECVFVNQGWAQLTGLETEEANGTAWNHALHPNDRERVLQEWADASRDNRPFVSEYRYLTALGPAWVLGNAVPLRGPTGKLLGHLGTAVDITERKLSVDKIAASLAEKEVLLREVHHRVKNNLQVRRRSSGWGIACRPSQPPRPRLCSRWNDTIRTSSS